MLIPIPPYVLACESPPDLRADKPYLRGFRLRSYEVVEPIAFPRELFADVLVEHARLLDAHGTEIITAPLDHPGQPADERFVEMDAIDAFPTLLVGEGTKHAVHKWRTADLSYVVERCRGILLRLMEMPRDGFGYVVVVARGVASLHLVRGVRPRRAGDPPQMEVVKRNLVVEPWFQTHHREGEYVVTRWRTPLGELAMSRVRSAPKPNGAHAIATALMKLYDASLHEHLDDNPLAFRDDRLVAHVLTTFLGDEIDVWDRHEPDPTLIDFPEVLAPMRSGRPGLTPVVVQSDDWAALCWIARPATSDVAIPPPIAFPRKPYSSDAKVGDAALEPKPAPARRRRLRSDAYLVALFDDFPPLDPWEPPASDVHAAWRMGLALALLASLELAVIVRLIGVPMDSIGQCLGVGIVALLTGVLASGGYLLRYRLRRIDPVRRRGRWRAWKQVQDELKATQESRADPNSEVRERKLWMNTLAQRLARLERLVDLEAPPSIITNERGLVRKAIAELDKRDADAVLAAWPRAVRLLEAGEKRRDRKDEGGGGSKAN